MSVAQLADHGFLLGVPLAQEMDEQSGGLGET